jgi:hypothetical protein
VIAEMKNADPVQLIRLLRLSGTRRSEGRSQRGQQEAAAVHAGWWGRRRSGVNAEDRARYTCSEPGSLV